MAKRKSVITKGKTVEEAVNEALSILGVTLDEVETKVIDIPSAGFLGIGGNKAKVEVSVMENSNDAAQDFLCDILNIMEIPYTIDTKFDEENNCLYITLDVERVGMLVGKHGQTLDALQYITSLVANKNSDEYIRIILDINGYRKKRQETLETLAGRLAKKVLQTGESVSLEPMNPYERRIIHSYLQGFDNVSTHSEGEGERRHLIIEYKDE